MASRSGATLPAQADLYSFLDRALSGVRWLALAVLFLLSLAPPLGDGCWLPTWLLLVLFAGYGLLMDWLQHRLRWPPSSIHRIMLDVPVTLVVYFLGGAPGGLLFPLFFLAFDHAAASMTPRGILRYTLVVAVSVAVVDVILVVGAPTAFDIRLVAVRGLILVLVGVGIAIVTRRLTIEQGIAQASRDVAERLADLDQLRAQFLSTVSHELRTPLTAARAALGLIETSAVDRLWPDEQGLLSNARRNVERLSILIDDLLSFNQLGAGTLHLDRESLDLRTVVTDSLAAVYPLIVEKGQTLVIALPEPLPYQGDARQLEQVVVNLLANAHRHNPAGTCITIEGQITAAEVIVSVSDNGVGIPAEELNAIFQRFHRLRPSDQGSGLGLAIAKAVVELHGGRMWAESELDHGATFHFALPHRVPVGEP